MESEDTKFTKVHYDFTSLPWLTSPRKQLHLKGVALGFINIPADEGYSFTHSHRKQEEVYIVIKGNGSILVDNETIALLPGDIIRVAPEAKRALKAGHSGILIICAGAVPAGYPQDPHARYLIDDGIPDYDDIPPWYQGDQNVIEKNNRLKERYLKTIRKRQAAQSTS